MSTKPEDGQLSFLDLGEPAVNPESIGVRTYDFSAVNTFPAAEAAHSSQEATLADSSAKGPMNPAALEEKPSSVNPTSLSYTNPAKIQQQQKVRKARNQRSRARRDPGYYAEPR
jgi:hypothetical protein